MTSPSPSIVVGLNAVILAVTDEEPRLLVVGRDDLSPAFPEGESGGGQRTADSLPYGPLDPESGRTLELTLRGWVRQQTGIELGYVEQLYTFGDRNREPRESHGGSRVVSIVYLTLGREAPEGAEAPARWQPWYQYFPWEDWREGRPKILDEKVIPRIDAWLQGPEGTRERRERVEIAFGLSGAPWDAERALDRYELLYEAGLVWEACRDRDVAAEATGEETRSDPLPGLGRPMAFDHRRMVATALSRLRGKIKYRPVVFELLPPTFTLLQLQRVVEALAGRRLHKQNFRRLMEKGGLVEGTGELSSGTGGRPAALFRFRREVLRERPTPGVGLPALPTRSPRSS